ncbi:hypothetical protein JDY09_07480 [Thermoleophilum album]|jgi:predicted Fe-S protein YdhL (DUF1289 family)|uniref:hypothetical protein n=1 Tax=Thermoleophilum album TaxID=29539 RepID=UPI00237D2D39|nr:hypothetical protein [Thermoleophilum album]WDT93223.1 hypothetical protein JDY09_07480 [Thermoleophilum album]
MPDIAQLLVRHSLAASRPAETVCSGCERTLLTGERWHQLDDGRTLCDLCFSRLPEESRQAVRSERVRALGRTLAKSPCSRRFAQRAA